MSTPEADTPDTNTRACHYVELDRTLSRGVLGQYIHETPMHCRSSQSPYERNDLDLKRVGRSIPRFMMTVAHRQAGHPAAQTNPACSAQKACLWLYKLFANTQTPIPLAHQ